MTEYQRRYEIYWGFYLRGIVALRDVLFWRAAWLYGKPVALRLYPVKRSV